MLQKQNTAIIKNYQDLFEQQMKTIQKRRANSLKLYMASVMNQPEMEPVPVTGRSGPV
jgi:hypothetical protein